MKYLWILSIFLCCISCKQQKPTEEIMKEIVISGQILNKEVYPNEKKLKLVIPFFPQQETFYISAIADDGTFSFRFPSYTSLCEVSLCNYAEHLYVRPGDSLHVEIDFQDLLHPRITGTSGNLNKYMSLFTDGGYYRMSYPYDKNASPEIFEETLKTEYNSRLERRNDFLKKYSPGKEIEKYTADLLLIDYYSTLFGYTFQQILKGNDIDADKYKKLLSEANSLFVSDDIVFANQFSLVKNICNSFHAFQYRISENTNSELDELLKPLEENAIKEYLYAYLIGSSLLINDTTCFTTHRQAFDSIVQNSYLKQNILCLYKKKVDYLNNPQSISDYMLYGYYPDNTMTKNMSFMTSVHHLLEKHKGKVVYINFWTTTCPPCLAEMEPLKKLREQYSPREVAMVSICDGRNRTAYEQILERFSLNNRDIDCIFWEDWIDAEDYRRVIQHWNMHSHPQYLLINQAGVIVNYGTILRPSYPGTTQKINELLN